MERITFLGCGSWGGALGKLLSEKGANVTMWHRNSDIVEDVDYFIWGNINEAIDKTNVEGYLPDTNPDNCSEPVIPICSALMTPLSVINF